jgi:hypothetical protein
MDGDRSRLPLRLVVTDDLERRRVTVFFRVFLAIPHLIVVGFWGIAAAAVSIILWLAFLFEGKAPRSLQSFVAAYLRYSVHVTAYLYLAAGPWPAFGGSKGYPVDLEIDLAARQSRGRVAARLVLAVPALILSAAIGAGAWIGDISWVLSRSSESEYSTGFTAAGVGATAAFLAWFASLARGRTPQGLRDLVAYKIGFSVQVTGYLLLVTDRYPTSDPDRILPNAALPEHPVRLELSDRVERSRLTVFFRFPLTVPHLVWLALWSILMLLAVLVAWVVALVTGRVPHVLHRFIAAWVRYATHVAAFLFLVGGPFPGFVGASGSYPVDLAIDPPAPERRLITLFRGLLGFPALLLSFAFAGVLLVVGFLGWWAALFTGRMPEGLRNLGAVCLRYSGQVNAYIYLLTDRYPYSAPHLRDRPRDVQLELPLEAPAGIEPV